MCSAFRKGIGLALLATLAWGCTQSPRAPSSPQRTLRVCSDPNNLPFSNERLEGFENKIADLVAARLNARLEYVWWAQRRGYVRNTLRAGLCDAVMGMPAGMDIAATTQPYYRSGYVFVTRHDTPLPASLDDPLLKTALVGVHIIGDDFSNSPPAHALTNRGVVTNVRGYSIYGDYRTPNPPAALIEAVARRDVDVAIAWGPLAGYFAQRAAVPLRLRQVTPASEPPFHFAFDIAMAAARSNTALRDELDAVIAANRSDIERILRDYSVPVLAAERMAAR